MRGDPYIKRMTKTSSPVTARLRRGPPVLICKKCLTRVNDGSGLKRALKSEVKRRGKMLGLKKSRVVMTSCFGICPKRAVVVASAATLQRKQTLLVAVKEMAAEAAAILMPEA